MRRNAMEFGHPHSLDQTLEVFGVPRTRRQGDRYQKLTHMLRKKKKKNESNPCQSDAVPKLPNHRPSNWRGRLKLLRKPGRP